MGTGTSTMGSIFISYSHADRTLVEPVAAALERRGFEVWWDKKLRHGRWEKELSARLDAADRVIAFVTRNAVDAKLDYVLVEMTRAREQDKLVPLRIGDIRLPLSFDAVLARVQTYSFATIASALDPEGFELLCRACDLSDAPTTIDSSDADSTLVRVRRWFASGPSPDALAFAISLAVLEHAPLGQIRSAANDLAQLLLAPVTPAESATAARQMSSMDDGATWLLRLGSRAERLQAVAAVAYRANHPRLGVEQECCRFEDPDRAAALLFYVWQELDQLQEPLVQWLEQQVARLPAEARMRVGMAVGGIAQANLPSVFDRFLRRWLVAEQQTLREVADIALSVASVDPGTREAIKRIVGEWSRNTNSPRHVRVAVELSCGYTGMRNPQLAISTLQTVAGARLRDEGLIALMKETITLLISAASDSGDSSLLDLPQLIEVLAAWVQQRTTRELDRLPMLLFLTSVADLPLVRPAEVSGVLALSDVVPHERTLLPFVEVLSAALRDGGDGAISPRQHASMLLGRWAADQQKEKHDPDPVLALARALAQHASSSRDLERIRYVFRKQYSADQLRSHEQ